MYFGSKRGDSFVDFIVITGILMICLLSFLIVLSRAEKNRYIKQEIIISVAENMQKEAVEKGHAYYNPTNAVFTWKEKGD